jgi:hypothetical protein
LGKENGRGEKDKNSQEDGNSPASLQESHGIHANQINSLFIKYSTGA